MQLFGERAIWAEGEQIRALGKSRSGWEASMVRAGWAHGREGKEVIWGPNKHDKNFDFYSENDQKPLESFK